MLRHVRLPSVALVGRLAAVHRLQELVPVDRLGRICLLDRLYRLVLLDPVARVFSVGGLCAVLLLARVGDVRGGHRRGDGPGVAGRPPRRGCSARARRRCACGGTEAMRRVRAPERPLVTAARRSRTAWSRAMARRFGTARDLDHWRGSDQRRIPQEGETTEPTPVDPSEGCQRNALLSQRSSPPQAATRSCTMDAR